MAISEFEIKQWEKELGIFLELRRPPAHIRDQLDIGFRIENQSIELYEIRPVWNNPSEKSELSIAKATYIKKSNTWKVYWQRQDLKWHSYEPTPNTDTLREFLELVNEDKYACFFG